MGASWYADRSTCCVYSFLMVMFDTTRTNKEIYHDLTSRIWGLPDVLRGHELFMMKTATAFRILRPAGIAVPETAVIRARGAVGDEHLYELWRTMHTPGFW